VSTSTDVLYYMTPVQVAAAILRQEHPVHFAAIQNLLDCEMFPDDKGIPEATVT